MSKNIRILAQYYDKKTGELIEELVLHDEEVIKAQTLKGLGYLHREQIEILQQIQDFKIKYQMLLTSMTTCPKCAKKTRRNGVFSSKFHAALTDHKAQMQRVGCQCGWKSASSIDGMYGSSMHPDLLEKQAMQGSQMSYEKTSKSLNAESAGKRAINSHSQIYKSVQLVSEPLETIRSSFVEVRKEAAHSLVASIDGGHIKSRGDKRSFEAMIATVYRPENLKYVDKHHNSISSKSTVASAKDDDQKTMKLLFKNACTMQGMSSETTVTCLADGAENCQTIAYSIKNHCKNIIFILDWFHIAMKFKNIKIHEKYVDLLAKIKWHLWHGDPDTAISRLGRLKALISDSVVVAKLEKLSSYIYNNRGGIVNYGDRQAKGLVFTSNLAESTVNSLINERQKGKQKMAWSRDGAHHVLQIRASIYSNSWQEDWKQVEQVLYKQVA